MEPTLVLDRKSHVTVPRVAEPAAVNQKRARGETILNCSVQASAQRATARPRYDRTRDLAGLLPLWPAELADDTPAGRNRLVQKLRRALREERRRGVAGHWTYNLARHAALLRAYRAELSGLDSAGP